MTKQLANKKEFDAHQSRLLKPIEVLLLSAYFKTSYELKDDRKQSDRLCRHRHSFE